MNIEIQLTITTNCSISGRSLGTQQTQLNLHKHIKTHNMSVRCRVRFLVLEDISFVFRSKVLSVIGFC